MNGLRLRVHEDVVQVDHHKNIRHILEDVVHKVLKCGQRVGKSHWHDKKFKGAITGLKHCFPFVTGGDADVVISGTQVKFGVDFGQPKVVNEVLDQWYGVSILLGNLVEVLKLTQSRRVPSFFLESRTGAPPGELDAQIKPFPSISSKNSQRMLSSVPDKG